MSRIIRSSAAAMAACLLASCSAATVESAYSEVPETETSIEATTETTAEPTAQTTAEETWPEDRYEPFASGHGFSLIEEGYATAVTDQQYGTCWAHSAATSIESNLLLTRGETITIDPLDIVDATYGSVARLDPDRDGFHPRQYSAYNVGAGPIQTIAGLANGIECGIVLTDASDYSELSREQIQEALRTSGAFTVGYLDRSTDYYEIYGFTTLNNHEDIGDHSVTVVGWDDDFPGEYFDPPAQEDGAWLVQNSFSERWGDGGYFWLSYETGFEEPVAYEGSTGYSHVCSYDGSCTNTITTGGQTVLANVFEQEGILGAIGTYTPDYNQQITVEIYDGVLDDGELLYSASEEFTCRGYHTVELPEPLQVDTFTIVVRYESEAPVEGESTEAFYDDSYIAYIASSEPGQSYVLIDNEWIDLSDPDISGLLDIEFVPNNACIKALFV